MVHFESELTINLAVDITEDAMVLQQCIPATRVFGERDVKQAKHPRRSSSIRYIIVVHILIAIITEAKFYYYYAVRICDIFPAP